LTHVLSSICIKSLASFQLDPIHLLFSSSTCFLNFVVSCFGIKFWRAWPIMVFENRHHFFACQTHHIFKLTRFILNMHKIARKFPIRPNPFAFFEFNLFCEFCSFMFWNQVLTSVTNHGFRESTSFFCMSNTSYFQTNTFYPQYA